jgi:hypothetical protein
MHTVVLRQGGRQQGSCCLCAVQVCSVSVHNLTSVFDTAIATVDVQLSITCLCSVIPGLHRVAAREIELGGYAVPAGTMLYSPLHLLAKSDPRWADEDPEAFRWGGC